MEIISAFFNENDNKNASLTSIYPQPTPVFNRKRTTKVQLFTLNIKELFCKIIFPRETQKLQILCVKLKRFRKFTSPKPPFARFHFLFLDFISYL
ncbi:hypothetical protein HMPREF0766_14374 [Sphingobacterium spiritivorum ATCC 33861]|uniref:Uncharacterized protein n=1 Tax=Sphingobacterium spiritivorum ATCC 33861 TaxID=525373 RepID=D7VTQ4_SPHSI|nr:hypothetical protein HMPREF0766_14374 [Sphingobacterium spiritivorum ATCC 33861]